ncbi:hypothetical protein CEXT_671791 [Caerostris extrusa]|uniref:Uncharacterized protein n=1 Tax=Caerostris extrusa TaxID=172846 RepID=A0AAV4XMB6_CAEEX|nr:hypothetical protein CEXT_671791 [Caerostris extrusa]
MGTNVSIPLNEKYLCIVVTDVATCHTACMREGNESFQTVQAIEMARHLENWSRLEVRAAVRFLWADNVSASDIHSQIVKVYGEEAISKHVAK